MHQMHERRGCISQTEREDEEFEVAVASAKGCLRHIVGMNAKLMVAAAQVDLAEIASASQSVEQLVYARQRVRILDCDVIERAVVDAEAQAAVLLAREDDVGTPRRSGVDETSSVEVLLQLLLQLVELLSGEASKRLTVELRRSTACQCLSPVVCVV